MSARTTLQAALVALIGLGCGTNAGKDLPPPNLTGSGGTRPVGTNGGPAAADGGLFDAGDGGVALSDDAIAGVITEINDGEVMIGNQAGTLAQDPNVRAFAVRMATEHGTANDRLMNLQTAGIAASGSDLRQAVAVATQQTLTQLGLRTGAAYDSAYLATEAEQHRQLIGLLDDAFIPSVQSAELRNELVAERTLEEAHLITALALAGAAGAPDAGTPERD